MTTLTCVWPVVLHYFSALLQVPNAQLYHGGSTRKDKMHSFPASIDSKVPWDREDQPTKQQSVIRSMVDGVSRIGTGTGAEHQYRSPSNLLPHFLCPHRHDTTDKHNLHIYIYLARAQICERKRLHQKVQRPSTQITREWHDGTTSQNKLIS